MTGHQPLGVAVVGCGTISEEYLGNLASFPDVQVLFCADLEVHRAKERADAFGVPAAGTLDEALRYPGVELVVNLTVPAAHAEVSLAAVAAGKHVWTEKPLAHSTEAGQQLLEQAGRAGVRVGCAPDTVLGAGLQSASRLIRSGAIGTPLSAVALMQDPGPESWHPSPEFLYEAGAGPLFDVGPYYLATLAMLFGPATRVAAVGRSGHPTRTIASGPRRGTNFGVSVSISTHVAALLEYAGGAVASVLFSFDSPLTRHGFLEITGSEATLAVPSPTRFGGELQVRKADSAEWTVLPAAGSAAGRGVGVLDMVRALRTGEPHRASGEMGLHVLETMVSIDRSAATGLFEPVRSGFTAPEPLAAEWDPCVPAASAAQA